MIYFIKSFHQQSDKYGGSDTDILEELEIKQDDKQEATNRAIESEERVIEGQRVIEIKSIVVLRLFNTPEISFGTLSLTMSVRS